MLIFANISLFKNNQLHESANNCIGGHDGAGGGMSRSGVRIG
jgi:hypothetical protein